MAILKLPKHFHISILDVIINDESIKFIFKNKKLSNQAVNSIFARFKKFDIKKV